MADELESRRRQLKAAIDRNIQFKNQARRQAREQEEKYREARRKGHQTLAGIHNQAAKSAWSRYYQHEARVKDYSAQLQELGGPAFGPEVEWVPPPSSGDFRPDQNVESLKGRHGTLPANSNPVSRGTPDSSNGCWTGSKVWGKPMVISTGETLVVSLTGPTPVDEGGAA